jgi:hypothetical protein
MLAPPTQDDMDLIELSDEEATDVGNKKRAVKAEGK